MPKREVLRIETSEINWPVIELLSADRGMRYLAILRRERTWRAPVALEPVDGTFPSTHSLNRRHPRAQQSLVSHQPARMHRAGFAISHSIHAARFMHHCWRAWIADGFVTRGRKRESSIAATGTDP